MSVEVADSILDKLVLEGQTTKLKRVVFGCKVKFCYACEWRVVPFVVVRSLEFRQLMVTARICVDSSQIIAAIVT